MPKKSKLHPALEAVKKTKKGDVVLVEKGSGRRPVERKVVTGVADDKNVEIVSGLAEEDTVMIPSVKKNLPAYHACLGANENPQVQFFAGQLVFKDEGMVTRWLHNHTVFELQRRLYRHGRAMLILPIRV